MEADPAPVDKQEESDAPTSANSSPLDYEQIQYWLVTHLAKMLGIAAEQIDVQQPFAAYGLDSVEAIGLTGDLEEWLGRDLPATLAWDYPNVEALAKYLSQSRACP